MRREDLYTLEGQQLVLNKEYIRGIPQFKCILERPLSSKGDHDGRKKLQHWKIFMYIKITADLFSYPNQAGMNTKDLHKEACRASSLEDNYKPDEEVLAAIAEFRRIQLLMLPVLESISTTLKACRLSTTICNKIMEGMEGSIEVYNKKIENQQKAGEINNVADTILLVNGLIAQLEQVNKIGLSTPKVQETLERLDERLRKESSGETLARGGRKIGNRADPKRD